jgi:PleD family two-component response regulator
MISKRLHDETSVRHAALERQSPLLNPQLSLESYHCLVAKYASERADERDQVHPENGAIRVTTAETNTVGEAPRSAPVENGKQPQMRLLLVEDHLDTAQTISRLLHFNGFKVTVASDVASASAAAEAEPFDVVVCDLGLPDGDGCELMLWLPMI